MVEKRCLDLYGEFTLGQSGTFLGPKMVCPKFYLMAGFQMEVKWSFFVFQNNFAYAQETPFLTFLGIKLTHFSFA